MKDWIMGIFLAAHGWAHVWYIILSQRLLEIEGDPGWTGRSWLVSGLLGESVSRTLATLGYSASLIGFIVGGASLLVGRSWWRGVVVASTIVSLVTIILFWDGEFSKLVDKGLIGLAINVALILYLTYFNI